MHQIVSAQPMKDTSMKYNSKGRTKKQRCRKAQLRIGWNQRHYFVTVKKFYPVGLLPWICRFYQHVLEIKGVYKKLDVFNV